jgi:two-component sensor histidine kinase
MTTLDLSRGKNTTTASYLLEIVAVAVVYIVSARIGQIFAIEPGNVTPVWIPSGLMLAWALIRGNYIWPGIFIGAFLGNVWAYVDLSSVSIILSSLFSGFANGLGDSICTVGSAYFIKLMTGDGNPFRNFKAFLILFAFGVVLGPLVSAVMGASALLLTGFLPAESYLISLFTWFIGDAVGVLLFTPLILIHFYSHASPHQKLNSFELTVFLLILFSLPLIGFVPEPLAVLKQYPSMLMMPLFLWAALRMNQMVIFYAAAYAAIGFVVSSYFDSETFIAGTQFQSVLILQVFVIVTISSAFILSTLVTDKELEIKERGLAEISLGKSLNEKEVLLKEIHHRVKNNLQVVASLLSLQRHGETDPHTSDMLEESQRRIKVMAHLHETLYQSGDLSSIKIRDYLGSIVQDMMQSVVNREPEISCKVDVEEVDVTISQSMALGQILSELLSNCLKHAFPGDAPGTIKIDLRRTNAKMLELTVSDDGKGFPDNFKLGDIKTLGFKLVQALVQQLHGDFSIDTSRGTGIKITFKDLERT